MIVAMWSGPRNLSTAMMYSFGVRTDTEVVDEPFYGAFLAATGIKHPMGDRVISSMSTDPEEVVRGILMDQDRPIRFLKLMTHQMLPEFPRAWMKNIRHVFLIRHPARVIASYERKRENPTLGDLGFVQQLELFEETVRAGADATVVDADQILKTPERTLKCLCVDLSIPFQKEMLSWPKGGHASDGVWAPHWYGAVHQSTGFSAPQQSMPDVAPHNRDLFETALPIYNQMELKISHMREGA